MEKILLTSLITETIVSSDVLQVNHSNKQNNVCHDILIQGSTVGTTVAGFTPTGGSAYSELRNPSSIYVTPDGTLYVLDNLNYRVQKWLPGEPLGFTVAGGRGSGTSLTRISAGYGLFVDDQYNVYVSEYGNHRVSKWTPGNTATGVRVCTFCSSLTVL